MSPLFDGVYPNSGEISASLILLVAGGAVLGIASLRSEKPDEAETMLASTRPLPFGTSIDRAWLGAAVFGVLLWGVFLFALQADRYHHAWNALMLAALLLVAAPFYRRDLGSRRRVMGLDRWSALHASFLVVTVGAFIYLNARDLGSWKYSAVGDEYNNYEYALGIVKGASFNPWSHQGGDQLFSVFGAMGQALFMKIGNEDNFAWKLYSVFVAAISLIPFYFLVRELFRARVAVLATAMLASSHYIFGYAHHFLYLDGMFPTFLGLWLLVVGLRRDSSLALFGSGLALALGFYTYESGRAAVVVVCLFMLTFSVRSFRPAVFVPLAGGFILLVMPLFATDGPVEVVKQMGGQSVFNYSEAVTGNRYDRVLDNLQMSFVSFNFMTAGRHYTWGSMADPLTAMLFVLGLGVVTVRVRRPAYRLLFIWWIIEVAFNGFTNPYPQPAISRLHAAVPTVVTMAALAVEAVIQPVARSSPWRSAIDDRSWSMAIGGFAVAALIPVILYLNLYRFWVQLPERFGPPSWEPVVFRAYQEPQCEGGQMLVVSRTTEQTRLFTRAFRSYRVPHPPHIITSAEAAVQFPAGLPPSFTNVDCVIIQPVNDEPENVAVQAQVARLFPDLAKSTVMDEQGRSFVTLFSRQR